MSVLIDKWPRIALFAAVIAITLVFVLVMLVGGANSSVPLAGQSIRTSPLPLSSPTPTPQPAKSRLLTDPVPDPKQARVQWFSPTGHTLRGTFLDYWNKHGGLAQLGYPLTEEFFEPISTDNKLYQVQYFERARLELHPENAGTLNEVMLGLLGRELAEGKGYFTGVYPRYGHAADFSWISGKLTRYGPITCAAPICGCSIFSYETNGARMQLTGNGWGEYISSIHTSIEGLQSLTLTIFGRPASTGEVFVVCPIDQKAPGYVVDHVQTNSMP